VRSYNSEGCTEVSSCQATTKFIVGEPDDLETDPETRAESEGLGPYADEGQRFSGIKIWFNSCNRKV